MNCKHTFMTNLYIMLHGAWLAYGNAHCWKEGTNEAASFSKPCRTVFSFAEIPEITTHEAIEFPGKHGEKDSVCK